MSASVACMLMVCGVPTTQLAPERAVMEGVEGGVPSVSTTLIVKGIDCCGTFNVYACIYVPVAPKYLLSGGSAIVERYSGYGVCPHPLKVLAVLL